MPPRVNSLSVRCLAEMIVAKKSQRWHEIRLHGVRMRQFNGHLVHPIGNRNKGSIFPIKENETVVLQKGSVSFPVSQQAHVS